MATIQIYGTIPGGGSGTEVIANPELVGTEAALTGLQVGDTKYKVPDNVSANPTLAGTESDLTGLQIGDTKYKVSGGGGTTITYGQEDLTPGVSPLAEGEFYFVYE